MNGGIVWRSAGSLTEMTPCFPHRWGVCWPSGLLLEQVFMTMLGKPKSKRKLPSVIICCTEDGSCCISYPGDILDSNSSFLASWNPLTLCLFISFAKSRSKQKSSTFPLISLKQESGAFCWAEATAPPVEPSCNCMIPFCWASSLNGNAAF